MKKEIKQLKMNVWQMISVSLYCVILYIIYRLDVSKLEYNVEIKIKSYNTIELLI